MSSSALSRVLQTKDGEISVVGSSAPELKLAMKELKLKKKELVLRKRLVAEQAKLIRASYTHEVRTRGSMVRGGGGLGGIIRAFQRVSRDSARAQLASDLAPLERQKQEIEAMIRTIDEVVLKIEIHLTTL